MLVAKLAQQPASAEMPQKDRELAQAVASGDPDASRIMASRLLGRAQRLCRYLVRDVDPDDLAQSALLEVFRSARTFRGDSSLERWADRITVRVALAHARSARRELALVDPDALPELVPDDRELAAQRATEEQVERLLRDMPDKLRLLLVLHYAMEHTVEEIAKIIDTPIGTVRERLLKARALMRKQARRAALVSAGDGEA